MKETQLNTEYLQQVRKSIQIMAAMTWLKAPSTKETQPDKKS